MAFQDTKDGFIDYRYYKPKFHYAKKIAIKFECDQEKALITFSCAICSEEDNFCRATARELTDKRMNGGSTYIGTYDRNITITENIREITMHIATGNDLIQKPDRLIKQLYDAFTEVEIAKMIDESSIMSVQDF